MKKLLFKVILFVVSVLCIASVANSGSTAFDLVISAGVPQIGSGNYTTTGNVFFVDSGYSGVRDAADRGTYDKPFATLDYAVGRCTANNGDIIFVAPGHAENLSTADGVDADVSGIKIVGLGEGSDRPTFTYTATAGEFVIGAADVTVENLRFLPGISAVTMGISVEAAGDYFTLRGCEFVESGTSTYEFLDAIDLATGADHIVIDSNVYYNIDNTGAAHFLEMGTGVNNDVRVTNNLIMGEFSVSAIWSDTVDLEVFIAGNDITNATNGQHAVEFTGAATGTIRDCVLRTNANLTDLDPGSLSVYNVKWDDDTTANTSAVDSWSVPGVDYVTQVSTTSGITNEDLFDVAGGDILIKSFWGLVTTNIQNQACTLEINIDADSGATDFDFSTAVDLDNDAAGQRIVFSNANEAVLTPLAGADGGGSLLMSTWYCPEGMIEQATSATNTGAITWFMVWSPVDHGVTVTPQ